jgi:hypothetical protein
MARVRFRRRPVNRRPENVTKFGAAAIEIDGSLVTPPFRGARIGTIVHNVIQEMVWSGARRPTVDQIKAAARMTSYVCGLDAPQHRQMMARRLATPAALYFGRHPVGIEWEVIGTEHDSGSEKLDIVWRIESGQILVDEIKSEFMTLARRSAIGAQADRQRAAGVEEWGADFAGVRVCVLMDPRRSFVLHADGSRGPVDAFA